LHFGVKLDILRLQAVTAACPAPLGRTTPKKGRCFFSCVIYDVVKVLMFNITKSITVVNTVMDFHNKKATIESPFSLHH
jgi:hypothetical protein